MAGAPLELLGDVPLFSELGEADLEQVARLFKRRHFSAGETVTKEGSGGAAFFLIESGTAAVTVKGRERPAMGPGAHFGEVALIDGRERSATITATSDLVCYGLTYWDFQPLVRTNAAIAWGLLQSMTRLLRVAQED
ncbi:MAG TPA: cyclic nucleotide-binding domain-containing protein [Solirubrobacteraceae bacterium]|nr:cyclic nucleotide-binding domain-containing protein [Solirubrobacteraceae bacterium]